MGLDGLFFARNDYRDKEQRMENKTLDMIWKAGMYFNFLIQYNFKLLHNISILPSAQLVTIKISKIGFKFLK